MIIVNALANSTIYRNVYIMKLFSLLVAIVLISGCTSKIQVGTSVNPSKAVVFASITSKFNEKSNFYKVNPHPYGGNLSLYFRDQYAGFGTDTRFNVSRSNTSIEAIQVRPGTYKIHGGSVFTLGTCHIYFSFDDVFYEDLKPGKVYYLGNFEVDYSYHLDADGRTSLTKLRLISRDGFANDKEKFIGQYEQFVNSEFMNVASELPTELDTTHACTGLYLSL